MLAIVVIFSNNSWKF